MIAQPSTMTPVQKMAEREANWSNALSMAGAGSELGLMLAEAIAAMKPARGGTFDAIFDYTFTGGK